MGVWNGRHIPVSCTGLHGSCSKEGYCHVVIQHQCPHSPGTEIHSDEWVAAYRTVHSLPNVASHGVANHSVRFVEPNTGLHNQNVESYWSWVKTKLKRMRGCHANQFQAILYKFMWRARCALQNIMHDVSVQYPI